jgi:molybdenum cofactor synthesis domain
MSKKNRLRILGLLNMKTQAWDKLAYLHGNAWGDVCVNGACAKVALHTAGTPLPEDADYLIVLPPDTDPPRERYLAVGAGEVLVWFDADGGMTVVNAGFVSVSSVFSLWRRISAGVLTVSDKGSRGEREDTAGPALESLAAAYGADVCRRDVLPDDRSAIAEKLRSWCDEGLHLILTTGGTGLSPHDVTPEALLDVQEKVAPGFGEMMRARSMLYTERGFLTRSIAVVRGGTLIVAFPGSERAVRQCFEAVAPGLRHGVEILQGWDAECGNHGHA